MNTGMKNEHVYFYCWKNKQKKNFHCRKIALPWFAPFINSFTIQNVEIKICCTRSNDYLRENEVGEVSVEAGKR